MQQRGPERGAAIFESELEVGFDERFEKRWCYIERGSQLLMLLVVLAAGVGLLGRGPVSHRTHHSLDDTLSVDFEPIARHGTSTQVTFHLRTQAARAAPTDSEAGRVVIPLAVDTLIAEPLGLQQVIPTPPNAMPGDRQITYLFTANLADPESVVRFVLKPDTVGPVTLHAHYLDAQVTWTQWVLP
jgi:hypothetical protein